MLFFIKTCKELKLLHKENTIDICKKLLHLSFKEPYYFKVFIAPFCNELKPHLDKCMNDSEIILVIEAKLYKYDKDLER